MTSAFPEFSGRVTKESKINKKRIWKEKKEEKDKRERSFAENHSLTFEALPFS